MAACKIIQASHAPGSEASVSVSAFSWQGNGRNTTNHPRNISKTLKIPIESKKMPRISMVNPSPSLAAASPRPSRWPGSCQDRSWQRLPPPVQAMTRRTPCNAIYYIILCYMLLYYIIYISCTTCNFQCKEVFLVRFVFLYVLSARFTQKVDAPDRNRTLVS